jgi:hypothetical protein
MLGVRKWFYLDEKVGLVFQGDKIASSSIMLSAISRQMAWKGVQCYLAYMMDVDSSLVRPSPYSQGIDQCFFQWLTEIASV